MTLCLRQRLVHSRCLINRFCNKGAGKEKLNLGWTCETAWSVILGSDSIADYQVAEAVVGGA